MVSTKWLRHLYLVCFASGFYLTVTVAHVCFIDKKMNLATNTLQWAIPRIERCYCQRLVALGVFKAPACSTLKEDDTDLWFIDDPIPLLNRKNWVPTILDELLQRNDCCEYIWDLLRRNDRKIAPTRHDKRTFPHNWNLQNYKAWTSFGINGQGKATTATNTTATATATAASVATTEANSAVTTVRHQQDDDDVSRAAATEKNTSSVGIVQTIIHRATTELTEILQGKATTPTTTAASVATTEANPAVTTVRHQQDDGEVSGAAATENSTSSVDIVQTKIHRATTELTEILQVCTDKLGMENGDIADESISASSEDLYNGYGYVYQARLNDALSWRTRDEKPWIQADIGYQTSITGVITQGDGGLGPRHNWVTALMVSTFLKSTDDVEVFVEDDNGQSKIFQANTDRYTEARLMFPEPTFARIVRISCLDSTSQYIQMRFEILGCKYSN